MGISIELYRIRIGHFEANNTRKKKCNKLGKNCSKVKQLTVFIFSIVVILQLCGSIGPTQNELVRTTSPANIKNGEFSDDKIKLYSWAQSGLSINKFQKIINGNRRSVGYRLAMWNCGGGLAQEGF